MPARSATERYRAARDQILALRGDHAKALAEFDWPALRRPVQLGGRLVRQLRPRQRRDRAAHRRAGRPRGEVLLRRHGAPLRPGRRLAAGAGGVLRRPRRPDARQPGGALGVDARGDEARRGDHADDHRPRTGRPDRPHRARRRPARRRQRGRRGQVRRRPRGLHADRRRGRAGRVARLRATPRRPTTPRSGIRARCRATPCCSTSPAGRPAGRSWSSTPRSAIPSDTCRPCTGSACSPATCI